jgi:hypothetical protein
MDILNQIVERALGLARTFPVVDIVRERGRERRNRTKPAISHF